jgi:alanine dehydrogenase
VKVGIPKEVKDHEYRVGMIPAGVHALVQDDPGLYEGVNTYAGHITCQPVAESQNQPYKPLSELLA